MNGMTDVLKELEELSGWVAGMAMILLYHIVIFLNLFMICFGLVIIAHGFGGIASIIDGTAINGILFTSGRSVFFILFGTLMFAGFFCFAVQLIKHYRVFVQAMLS